MMGSHNFPMGFTDVLGHFNEQLQKSLLVHVCFGSFLLGKKRSLVLLGCGLGDLCQVRERQDGNRKKLKMSLHGKGSV